MFSFLSLLCRDPLPDLVGQEQGKERSEADDAGFRSKGELMIVRAGCASFIEIKQLGTVSPQADSR